MQISKCVLTVCAAVCALSLYGEDNEAQIKAREALQKQGQAPQSTPAAVAPVMKAPAPAPKPVAQTAADDDTIAKAREAVQKKMDELQGQPPQPKAAAAPAPAPTQPPPPKKQPKSEVPPPAPAVVAAPTPHEPVVVVPPPANTSFSPVPSSDPEEIAKARQALREKMQALDATPSSAAASAPASAALPPPAPAVAVTPVEPPTTPSFNALPEADPASINKARESVRMAMSYMPPEAPGSAKGTGLNFPPLKGPPSGISAEKEQRLQGLLQQYKMDLISPEQYQAARAKILAEP